MLGRRVGMHSSSGNVFIKAKGWITKLFDCIESVSQMFISRILCLADVLECIQVLGDVFI